MVMDRCAVLEVVRALDGDGPVCSTIVVRALFLLYFFQLGIDFTSNPPIMLQHVCYQYPFLNLACVL